MGLPVYVLVTPARNEEALIERTIQAVVAQRHRPLRWVIVSDGSTDRTDEIVEPYAREHDFIEFVRSAREQGAGFGSKVRAFRAGYAKLEGLEYDFIGNLDADVGFEPDYFEVVLAEFENDPSLGLVGGTIVELVDGAYVAQTVSENSVAGAVQLFRRACFESIGGYMPLDRGGIDSAAEIMVRYRGWGVRTLRDQRVLHPRPVSTGHGSRLATKRNKGRVNYQLGYHPLFQLAVCARRLGDPPVFLGSAWMLAGYVSAFFKGVERPLPNKAIRFLRAEQLARLGLTSRMPTPETATPIEPDAEERRAAE